MTYATVAQLKEVVPARDLALLTDFEGAAVASDARLIAALEDATAEIDGYIAKVVTLPITPVPRVLTILARDLAMHRLYINLGHDADGYKRLRSDAIALLKSIAKGETAIGGGTDVPTANTSPGVVMTDGPARRLTRDSLRGF